MNRFFAAFRTEGLKAWKSSMLPATIIFFVFIDLIMGVLSYLANHPEIPGISALMGAKASAIGASDWPSYFGLLIQIVLILGVIGFGLTASWVFGREFVDRTLKDLLALPVSRSALVISKLLVVMVWNMLLILVMFGAGIAVGLILSLPGWSDEVFRRAFSGFFGSAFLTMLLTTPVALIASVGRGYLLPVGFVIAMLILAQIVASGLPGIAPYFPWTIPALYSGVAGTQLPPAGIASYCILLCTSFAGAAGTVAWWRFADHT